MNREDALEVGRELRDAGIESFGHIALHEDAEEFGGGYSVRFQTRNSTLSAEVMGVLNANGVSLTHLGECDRMEFNTEWLVESGE